MTLDELQKEHREAIVEDTDLFDLFDIYFDESERDHTHFRESGTRELLEIWKTLFGQNIEVESPIWCLLASYEGSHEQRLLRFLDKLVGIRSGSFETLFYTAYEDLENGRLIKPLGLNGLCEFLNKADNKTLKGTFDELSEMCSKGDREPDRTTTAVKEEGDALQDYQANGGTQ